MSEKGIIYAIRHFRFRSLFVRNFVLILLVVSIPFGVMTGFIYYNMNDSVKEEIGLINLNSINRFKDVIDTVFSDVESMAISFSLNQYVKAFMTQDSTVPIIDNQNKYISDLLKTYVFIYDYIDSVYLYSDFTDFVTSNEVSGLRETLQDRSWIDAYHEIDERIPSYVLRKKYDVYPYLISFMFPYYGDSNNKQGVIIINLDTEYLREFFNSSENNRNELIILDSNDEIVLSSERESFKNSFDVRYDVFTSLPNNKSEIVMYNGQSVVATRVLSDKYEFSYISFFPLGHYQSKTDQVLNIFYILMTIMIIVALSISVFLSYRTYRPVKNIIDLFERGTDLKLDNVGEMSQEVKLIVDKIVNILYSNHYLESELVKRVEALHRTELVALQAQVNPHFLFNTLETTKWLAFKLTGKENEASVMVNKLSRMLRYSLDSDEQMIALSDEVNHARTYVDIMLTRYGDRVDFHWEIDEELLELKVCKFVFQPLIENAIYHGIKPLSRKGNIWIRCYKVDNEIFIEIEDDGIGASCEESEEINRKLLNSDSITGSHIGLYNTSHRIKLIYGDSYGVKFIRKDKKGVLVQAILPNQYEMGK